MKFSILHNPRCSKSRETLALIQDRGHTPQVIEYLSQPPSVSELKQILALLKLRPRDILRTQEEEYLQAGLDDASLSDEQILEKMVAWPKVIERPIVIAGDRAVIGRPPENVLALL